MLAAQFTNFAEAEEMRKLNPYRLIKISIVKKRRNRDQKESFVETHYHAC